MSIGTLHQRPRGLDHTAVGLCIFILSGYTFYNPEGNLLIFASLYSILAAGSLALTWYYWRGRNWARRLVLLVAAGMLVNLRLLGSLRPWEEAVTVAAGIFGGWLLYWLNTRHVALYFRNARRPVTGKE